MIHVGGIIIEHIQRMRVWNLFTKCLLATLFLSFATLATGGCVSSFSSGTNGGVVRDTDSVVGPRESTPTATIEYQVTPTRTAVDQSISYRGWIAFAANLGSGWDIHIINPDSLETRTLGVQSIDVGFPAWSPTWDRIVFVSEPDDDFYLIELKCLAKRNCDSTIRRFPVSQDISDHLISWYLNAESILYSADRPHEEVPSVGVPQIWSYSINNGNSTLVLDKAGTNPVVSPTGEIILFNSVGTFVDTHIMRLTVSSGSVSRFMPKSTEVPNSAHADWSPDGARVAFMTTFGSGHSAGDKYSIFVANNDGTNYQRIVEDGLFPDWSPDGRFLVFEREDGLYVVEVQTRIERKILDLPITHPAPMPVWSP
jgi:Tol biopolymer transport system component